MFSTSFPHRDILQTISSKCAGQISIKSIKKELDSEYLFKLTSRLEEMGY